MRLQLLLIIRRFIFMTLFLVAINGLFSYDNLHGTTTSPYFSKLAPTKNKYALLVGIDTYQNVKGLQGCVNDVLAMKDILIKKFGFFEKNILVLKNEQATYKAIIEAFQKNLIEKAAPNDVVLFHFSGHGSQQKDNDPPGKDEVDGLDETLIPYDYNSLTGGKAVYGIADDEISGLLKILTTKTHNVTVILDACHSGGGTKNLFVKRSLDNIDGREPPKLPDFAVPDGGVNQEIEHKTDKIPYILISGCQSNEQSYEYQVVPGIKQGLLTYFLLKELSKAKDSATYNDIMDNVKSDVTIIIRSQHPQIEGAINSLIFGERIEQVENYLLVSPAAKDTAHLLGGEMLGVTEGSEFEVYPPGSKKFALPEQSIGEIRITKVGLNESDAVWKKLPSKPFPLNCRAIERRHNYQDLKLQVAFQGAWELPRFSKTKNEILTIPQVSEAAEGNAHLLLKANNNEICFSLADRPDGILDTFYLSGISVEDEIKNEINKWSKWFNVLTLGNGQSGLKVTLTISSKKKEAKGNFAFFKSTDYTFTEGEMADIEIENNSNVSLYIYLIDLQDDGSIDVIHLGELNDPPSNSNEPVEPHSKWKGILETYVKGNRSSNRDVLKLFASTNSTVNLKFLSQASVNDKRKGNNPFENLFDFGIKGIKPPEKTVIPLDSWITIEKVLVVEKK